jgi:hypothetical protein
MIVRLFSFRIKKGPLTLSLATTIQNNPGYFYLYKVASQKLPTLHIISLRYNI